MNISCFDFWFLLQCEKKEAACNNNKNQNKEIWYLAFGFQPPADAMKQTYICLKTKFFQNPRSSLISPSNLNGPRYAWYISTQFSLTRYKKMLPQVVNFYCGM